MLLSMSTGRQKLTLILAGGAILLIFAIILLLKGPAGGFFSGGEERAERETSLEEDLWNVDLSDPDAVRDVFELRFEKIRAGTARTTLAEFKLDGFALKPLTVLNSVVERECLPRVRGLKAKGKDLPGESLEQAVPGHLLHGDPVAICRDLVAQGLKRVRPGLEGLDGARLWAELEKVDALSADFFAGKTADLAAFDAFVRARQNALGDPELDSALFGVQDDHTRLGYHFDSFVSGEARRLPLEERLVRYESMARDFEQKNGISLQNQDAEQRDHLNRALRLLELDEQPNEERRYEIIKQYRGEKAARLDREERRETATERATLTSFETEREKLYAAIPSKPGSAAYEKRAAEIEAELTKKYFND